jgi:membrane dipeptidase
MRTLPLLALVFSCALACSSRSQPQAGSAAPASSLAPSLPAATATSAATPAPQPAADPARHARELAERFIVLDGHIDVPWRLHKSKNAKGELTEDISQRTEAGNFDYVRAKEGGLDAPFMSIYVPSKFERGGAKKLADSLIDMVEGFAQKSPDKFALAKTPDEVRKNAAQGKISLLLGLENGSPIEHKLENVRHFFERGVRYITLAHAEDNHLADASYDERHTHKGLSPFGEKVVAEMNRLGILVDVSHLSDDSFWDVLDASKVAPIASHSSCRKFTPGWQRNMSDEMIQALAKRGGVIQINFGSGFIDGEIQKQNSQAMRELKALLAPKKLDLSDPKAKPFIDQYKATHQIRYATVEQVADHIDHVRKLVGVDFVGFGSDFDGLGDTLPDGLKDVSMYPNLIRVLIERGYSDADIEKICSSNVLRVWETAIRFADK